MKVFLTSVAAIGCFLIISCSKHSTPPNPGSGKSSLFPLTQGSVWYYSDSAFSDSSVLAAYADTMTIGKETYTDQSGTIYLGLNNPYGWFDGSFVSVDPANSAIYEVDSPYFQPYTFFAVTQQDAQLIGTGTDNTTNPGCPLTSSQYGYVTPVTINGFSCIYNIEYTVDCSSNPQERIDSYVAPGTGVVRIVHYLPDSATGQLHEDYSQTLTSAVIK